ncbi:actin cytoskeleton-regulatory complex protein pan1-like [Ceratina calcarata]|uniref:Actin cytoskeleton-regulatory complex protein pan1-like n=1 Tax=Ceratina calcarata TaxID=156304 RepID=A0AAJ7JFY4_9HYME|nr:actin cytoskeleton-regulatory complex protein pan1-like [Ceratina calcarata]
MGKTPKKAAPGGDERNLYNRRLKATTAPSNSSETSLHKRQREYEILNRLKLNVLKKIPPGQCKNIDEVRLRGTSSKLPVKKLGRPPTSSKQKKSSLPDKGEETTSKSMQPESEETEVKLDSRKEDTKKENEVKNNEAPGKEEIDGTPSEPVLNSIGEEGSLNKGTVMEERTESQENATYAKQMHSNKDQDTEECADDVSLRFEPEENVSNLNSNEEKVNENKDLREEGSEMSVSTAATEVTKDGGNEKEEVPSESPTDTESYSAEVMEITTSEVSEASETASQNDVSKEKEKCEQSLNKDLSSVSYDPSIMLKDVQIKLNDCLKENTKVVDTSTSSVPSTPSQLKDASFGKTLRNISGRRSLTRMRHVTVRDRRYSPSDSMFVNTSSASLAPEETSDFKIMRYHHTALDLSTNGSPAERKRKLELEEWSASTKKPKTEPEYSLLNSSITLLKGFRRPIQVSTPVSELKFQSGKLELSDESKSSNDGKKWCAIM